jgi:hypothetical protein
MNKELMDYLDGNKNAILLNVVIGRESSKDSEHITISLEDGTELYKFWNGKNKKSDTPKHTGGKKSYAMLFVEAIEKHVDLSDAAISFIVKRIPNIKWNTGLLINKRSKKPLLFEDLEKLSGKSKKTLLNTIKELKQENILLHDKEGYKVSKDFIRKGGDNIG